MMAIGSLLIAVSMAIISGAVLPRIMKARPRWTALLALAIMLVGIVAGIVLGFPANPIGRALFIYGVVTALTAWTVAAPRLTSVILWSMVAAMLMSSALLVLIPGNVLAVGIGIALGVSFIWVGFQFWCYWDRHGWRVATGLIAISVISGIIAFTVPPSV